MCVYVYACIRFEIFYILYFQDKGEGGGNILMNAQRVKNEELLFITFVVS